MGVQGTAHGFRLNSLSMLSQMRTNSNQSMLEYVITRFSSLGAALKVSLTNVDADLKRVKGSIDIMNIEEAKSRCVCGFPFPLQSMCDTTAASCGGASAPRFPCSCDTTTAPIHLCSVRICPSIVRMLTETLRLSRSLIERTCPVPK